MSIETGGQAFPFLKWERDEDGNLYPNESEGMTLRDYFAAKAMQGFCVRENDASLFSLSILAEHSYDLADAMLKEREIGR